MRTELLFCCSFILLYNTTLWELSGSEYIIIAYGKMVNPCHCSVSESVVRIVLRLKLGTFTANYIMEPFSLVLKCIKSKFVKLYKH